MDLHTDHDQLHVLSVLVVDDQSTDASHVGDALTAAGYIVHLAANVTDALAMHADTHPDLVVSDVSMPDYDGPTLLQWLRTGGCTATFIAMTSDPTPEVRQRCRDAGATVCLPKPVNVNVLVSTAEQLLTHGPLRDRDEDPLDVELLDGLRATYLQLLPARAVAVTASELTQVAKAAHTLAGASAQFGYPGLASLCRTLERSAKAGERMPELVEAVVAAAAHIQTTSR